MKNDSIKKGTQPDIPALLEQIRELGSFVGWDGKTILTVNEIKNYCVPGNAVAAKGRTAIWLRSSKARKPMIIFPELVLLAKQFIAEPARRGKHATLQPSQLRRFVEDRHPVAYKLPGFLTHSGIYLALARRLLGLPDDYQDPTTVRIHAEGDEQRKANHPNISTLDGLLSEVLLAYAWVLPWQAPGDQGHDWVDLSYKAFFSRHRSMSRPFDEPAIRADLAALLQSIHTHPGHADICKIDLAIFGMLFLNALSWVGKIRASAVTSVVNLIADASDAGELAPILQAIAKQREDSALAMEPAFKRLINSR